ncbi:hypothetical protein N665_0595s0008 [Sinapis alba]|nr:hypothetical protein N665_0595s0008 [Sinapis alba]
MYVQKKLCADLTNTPLFDCDSVFFILLIDRPWQGTCSHKKSQMSLSSAKASSESDTSKIH